MAKTPALPAELTIYAVAELRSTLLGWVGAARGTADFRVNGAAVDEVDAAGVQLLISLCLALGLQQRRLQLVQASGPLATACRALGVAHLLDSGSPPGATA